MLLRYCYVVFALFTMNVINVHAGALLTKGPSVNKYDYINKNKNFSILPPDVRLGYSHIQMQKNITMREAPSDKKQSAWLINLRRVGQLATIGGLSVGSTLVHEYGHYHTLNFFYPKLVSSVQVNPSYLNPLKYFSSGWAGYALPDSERMLNIEQSPLIQDKCKLALGLAAGPLSGLAFNAAFLAHINLYQNYKKENDIKKAFEEMRKDPLGLGSFYDEYFVYKIALATRSIVELSNFIPFVDTLSGTTSDGYKILQTFGMLEAALKKMAACGPYIVPSLSGLYLGYSIYLDYQKELTRIADAITLDD